MSAVKNEALKLIERLPESATWDDLMYELYVRKKVCVSLDAVRKSKVMSREQAKKGCCRNEDYLV